MKIAISSTGRDLNSDFDKRFGRAEWFCIWDDQTSDVSFHLNSHSNASNGAGVKAAEKMVELGVEKVISGDFGPKAKDMLDKFDVQMVIIQEGAYTVEKIISTMKNK